MHQTSYTKLIIILGLLLSFFTSSYGQDNKVKTESDGFQWKPYREGGKIGMQLLDGTVIIPPMFYKVGYYNGYPFSMDFSQRIALFDKQGNTILPPDRFSSVKSYSQLDGKPLVVADYRTGYGVFNKDGTPLIPCIYNKEIIIYTTPEHNPSYYYLCPTNNSYALYDNTGKIIIEEGKYNELKVTTFDNGKQVRFLYTIYGVGCGVCDDTGRELFRTIGYHIDKKDEQSYEVAHGNSIGVVDLSGEWIENPSPYKGYYTLTDKCKDLFLVRDQNDKMGVVGKNERIVIPCIYDEIIYSKSEADNPTWLIAVDGFHKGLFLPDGTHLIDEQYDDIIPLDGYYSVKRNNKAGVIDLKGEVMLPPEEFDQAYYFKKGDFIMVAENGFYGLLNSKGDILFQTEYDDFGFEDVDGTGTRYAAPMYNGKFGLSTLEGNEIFPTEFDGFKIKSDGKYKYVLVNSGGYIGVADLEGNFLISPENFTDIKYKKGKFEAKRGEEVYVIDRKGNVVDVKNPNKERSQFIELAENAFSQEKYREAVKNYSKAIDIEEDALTYFNRGVSYYNLDKYDEAISDFNACLSHNPSRSTESRANELISKSKHYKAVAEQERAERRSQIAAAIFGLILTTTDYVIQQQLAPSSMPNANYNTGSYSSQNTSSYSSSYSNSSSVSSNTAPKQKKCGFCGGRGYNVEYTAGYGVAEKEYCSECGKTMMSNHYHAKCQHCNGTGYER